MRLACFAWRIGLCAAAFVGGCSSDIFDTDIDLATEPYQVNVGSTTGNIPDLMCDPATPTACGASSAVTFSGNSGSGSLTPGCDANTQRCFVKVDGQTSFEVNVLQDENFTTKVERRAISVVRGLSVGYAVPMNTLTFDLPQIDIAVSAMNAAGATEMEHVDVIAPLKAGATVSADQPRRITLADDSPARNLIAHNVMNKTPFTFILTVSTRVEAGAALPAGQIEIDLTPRLDLGLK